MGMWDDYVERGKTVEQQFASILSGAAFATIKQDIHEHWDVMDEMGVKYDVKGMKKYQRKDSQPATDRLHWIEFLNVNGDHGWLYGQADVIVFETRKWWLLVNREDLVAFAEAATKDEIWANGKPKPYEFYRRKDKKDKITILPTVDLLSIASQVLVKK
jgi:hypothetical protein